MRVKLELRSDDFFSPSIFTLTPREQVSNSRLAHWLAAKPLLTSDGTLRVSAAARSSRTESICFSVRGANASTRRSHSVNFSQVSFSVRSKGGWSVDAISNLFSVNVSSNVEYANFLFRDCGRGLTSPPTCSWCMNSGNNNLNIGNVYREKFVWVLMFLMHILKYICFLYFSTTCWLRCDWDF